HRTLHAFPTRRSSDLRHRGRRHAASRRGRGVAYACGMSVPTAERLTSKIRVRALEPGDSLAHLTGLLHRAYKVHADAGLHALAGDRKSTRLNSSHDQI